MPGEAGATGRQAAEGAAAAGTQVALQPGHLGAAHQGGAEEAGGGTSGGGEHQVANKKYTFKCRYCLVSI